MIDLVQRLRLPDDWRERLEELSQHKDEREQVEGKRRHLRGQLRRLRDLYHEGDFEKAEYSRRKAGLRTQLDALRMLQQPAIEEAARRWKSWGQCGRVQRKRFSNRC
ncbi:hypothetical protein ACFLT5_01635 [Chloroflexota bacterium]